ncbi:ubiquinol-cytochrome c reductase iron-sulfur subunit [Paenibacillus mucilaginosus]|uniref:Menaquinol:cytochrome c reductase iron-sulfur subunit n=3 Tax=Paenibacillus mucilaginosus TaxID=61624 RepID=H6NAJ0_9BACL|nr:ubiquinol-cytochrome c reductase iron-sulfur subunit [Paenibacillus mucilaginosus]AFC29915.1 Rieske domain-containing protein [Paenibacillus mucilaginosus 3016]AGN70503.1 2Fe-2S ferredoxin [Paenibacillus mucilaginosus K02]WFA18576.1 ubiquinol-cytochrome c reductase iron-sulfur subunit [Paenibacillus mucilaginosus]
MNDRTNQESQRHGEKPVKRREMSRRQFLSYTLGGAGAFMGAGMIVPMVRFAVDPVLQPKSQADWVKVVEEAQVTEVPKSFKFKVHQVDGWYESDPELEAWIAKGKDGKVFALNPTCKHLGCTVNWNGSPEHKDEYYCPCHGAHYTADGKNLAVAPLPLDEYEVKIEQGFVYLGQLGPNKRV